jgi:adenylate cyclase
VEQLIEDPDALKVGGRRRTLSFMFTDIAGFTTLSEQMDPDEMAEMLNEYLDGVCEIIIANHGVIDKFIGDAVVALFGVPNADPSHAANAIACARAVDAFCEAFRAAPGHENLGETRIGVHTGFAIVGNFGGHARFDYTAIGDAMNTAARLESANKTFGTRIAVSGDCLEAAGGKLPEDAHPQRIGRVVLTGKSEPLLIATFKKNAELVWINRYNEAYGALDTAPDTAKRMFADLRPDPVAAFHLSRLESGETSSLIVMKGK